MCDFDHKCQMWSYIEALGIFGLSEPILYFCGQKKVQNEVHNGHQRQSIFNQFFDYFTQLRKKFGY
jgi:hypothetical protein